MSGRFDGLEFHHIKRNINQAANVLAKMGTQSDPVPKETFLERLFKPSVKLQIGQEVTFEAGGYKPGHIVGRE
jgi:hypothetical protein